MTHPDTSKIRIFRMIDGVRVPFTLILDRSFTVLEEVVDEAALARVKIGRDDIADSGVPIPDYARSVMAKWITVEVPNPLPGTEALRDEYFERKAALAKHYEEQGLPCPDCAQASLIRRYRSALETAGHLKPPDEAAHS